MAHVYDARPAYPASLLEALTALAVPVGKRVGDVGAGIGHLALPLAARGFDVVAIEPAHAMLDRLELAARERGLNLRAVHAKAECLPLDTASLDLIVLADAVHFLDRELAASEVSRVLARRGALAFVTCELTNTAFMRQLVALMENAAPRRPRNAMTAIAQFAALANVRLIHEQRFHDATPVDPPTLERILRSISFIGPAMNKERFSAFIERVHALSDAPVWSRQFTLRFGQRGSARAGRASRSIRDWRED
jgi:SAM-dependent methyltransferase